MSRTASVLPSRPTGELGSVAATAVELESPGPGSVRGATVLLIEDDRNIQRSISFQLQRQGYRVTCCQDGETGLAEALRRQYSAVVVDVMLPLLDGLSLCKQVRRERPGQPLILISARNSDLDKITGLEFGADDYLSKPFSPAELEARIRALCRRTQASGFMTEAGGVLAVGEVLLDVSRHEARVGHAAVRLTPKELALLRLLMGAPGRVFTRENLLAQVWGVSSPSYNRAVDAHINRLKAKLAQISPPGQTWVEGVYGAGYRFCEPGPE